MLRHNTGLKGPTALGEPVKPFTTHAFMWPLNTGIQQVLWQAGGPSGFANGTAQPTPWPYLTAFKNFIAGMPYGSASTLVRNSGVAANLGSGIPAFLMQGMMKAQTYTASTF